jgi:hypothetical protein
VVPQSSGGCQHNYSTKTRQAGHANEHSIYSHRSIIRVTALRESQNVSFGASQNLHVYIVTLGLLIFKLSSQKKVENTFPRNSISRLKDIINICFAAANI